MKQIFLTAFIAMLATVSTQGHCRSKNNDGVVSRVYIHKYGVEVPQNDWIHRGKDGKIISKLTDGRRAVNTYVRGVLDGESTYTFPHNHTIEKREFYSDGILTKVIQNYPSGNPQEEISFETPDVKLVTKFYESGSISSKELIDEDFIISGEYFNANNKAESFVNEGNGIRINRDPFGTLESHDTIEEGELALRTVFHPNGSPRVKTPYVNGEIHGTREYYFPTGEPEASETWVNGQPHGVATLYKNGEVIAEVPYLYGVREGIERRYNDQGDVVEEVSWSHNQRHGPTFTYVEDITQTEWFHKGKPITKSSFDKMRKKR